MTVKKLIKELEQYPEDAEVRVDTSEEDVDKETCFLSENYWVVDTQLDDLHVFNTNEVYLEVTLIISP